MSDTYHLLKRGGAWYYHRRVPKTLQSEIGKQVLQFSLDTVNKKAAIKKREPLDVEWSKRFDEAEAALGSSTGQVETSTGQKRVLTEAEAVQRVRAYVEKSDERRRKHALTTEPPDADERREWEQELENDLAISSGRGRAYDLDEYISRQWERIFPMTDVAADEQTFPAAAVFDLVKRAATELAQRALARSRDDHRHSHFDHLFDPKQPPSVTVRELAEQFLELKSEEAQAHNVAKKTLDKQQAN